MHHHFIYGMDDGAKTYEDMTAMLRLAHEDGIRSIIATPHATPGLAPFPRNLLLLRLQEARQFCAEESLDLVLYPGAEIMYTPQAAAMIADGRMPPLADTKNVLLEFMPDVLYETLERGIQELLRYGYTPILAHVERYRCLMVRAKRARRLKEEYPVRFQVNCSTVLSGKGFMTTRTIDSLLRDKLIDCVATDAHDRVYRVCRMQSAYRMLEKKVGSTYAQVLTGIA